MLEMLFQRSDALNHRVLWVREKGEEMEPLIYLLFQEMVWKWR